MPVLLYKDTYAYRYLLHLRQGYLKICTGCPSYAQTDSLLNALPVYKLTPCWTFSLCTNWLPAEHSPCVQTDSLLNVLPVYKQLTPCRTFSLCTNWLPAECSPCVQTTNSMLNILPVYKLTPCWMLSLGTNSLCWMFSLCINNWFPA